MKKIDSHGWYVYLFASIISFITAILFEIDESSDSYLGSSNLPSGNNGKLGLILVRLADDYGGKPFVVKVFVILGVLFLIHAVRKYMKVRKG